MRAASNKASGVAVVHNESVLLAKRCKKCHVTNKPIPFGGYWSVFGGTIDEGETPKECAGRELYEESNIFVDFKDIIFVKSFQDSYSFFYFHSYFSNKILLPELSKEHTEFGWFKIADLSSITEPIDEKIIDCIKCV